MAERVIAAKEPIDVEVEEGETYWWCACGRLSGFADFHAWM